MTMFIPYRRTFACNHCSFMAATATGVLPDGWSQGDDPAKHYCGLHRESATSIPFLPDPHFNIGAEATVGTLDVEVASRYDSTTKRLTATMEELLHASNAYVEAKHARRYQGSVIDRNIVARQERALDHFTDALECAIEESMKVVS